MQTPLPLTRDLVLIGGGHTHALALRMWGMTPLAGVRLTLINPGPTAPYSGMLPGHIAGHYSREELDIDLVRLARFAGARLILGAASAIDTRARVVTVGARRIAYDVASIDVGIHAEMPDIPGFAAHGIGAKPLDVYAARWREFLARAAAGTVPPEVAVIGGGIAGIELALAMAHALNRETSSARVTLVEAGPDITARTPAARRTLRRELDRHGITLCTGTRVDTVAQDTVLLSDGSRVASHFTVGAAGAHAHSWLAESDLPLTPDGFVRVGADLRVEGFDTLFATGDCAHLTHSPRAKAGVFAVRAAPVLYRNLHATLTGRPTRRFRPQKDYLKLVSLGRRSALAEKWRMRVAGPLLWRWKDRIDQRFMEKFRTLPAMPAAPRPAEAALGLDEVSGTPDAPLCGGCGSKVGPATLSAALARLPGQSRPDVLSGPGDDAAILDIAGTAQAITTDHLRAFTEDPALLARIAALHALGDIWAMGARPQAALVSLTLPRMSETLQARTLDEIMGAAGAALGDAGAAIVGGHSTMGAEMSIGLTLTGLVPDRPVAQTGARPGDAILLTRPIGSGTLLAAEMRGLADGRDIAALFETMTRPQGDAAAMLQAAHAMTDVTGFGLAGHLQSVCRASGVAAEIDPAAIPVYDGAEALAAAGVRSTIFSANRDAAPVAGATGPRGALLHDPQTAGGLLAAVAASQAHALAARLCAAGHTAAVIGRFTEGPPALRCT